MQLMLIMFYAMFFVFFIEVLKHVLKNVFLFQNQCFYNYGALDTQGERELSISWSNQLTDDPVTP